jgi:hypothetical protein
MTPQPTDYIINRAEAYDEARRLTKVHGRSVGVTSETCACDYHPNCGKCGSQGYYYLLVFEVCGHLVGDGERIECEKASCLKREVEAAMRATDLFAAKPLRSLSEVVGEREEWEVANAN